VAPLLCTLFAGYAFAAPRIDFNRDVRPLLADRCFSCHGPDAAQRKARLRLDTAGGARAALAPGKPDESAVLERITRTDDGVMPPRRTGKTLTPAQIALLREWVAQGAPYQQHWAYLPPRRAALPAVRDAAWARTGIDRFLLARMEAARAAPAPQADAATLVRRLHLDLTGLPPTPAEVDAFLTDARLDAYERLVERLLGSPHFGERMGMYWLDLVRYADTVGYHGDQEHPIAPYRDWVLAAFNANMPFDRFTAAQLAGDLLPGAGEEEKIASGYNRLLQTTHEGGAQDGEYRAKYAADRIRNLSAVWLGATLGCAECHDHKYDPYTQRDFYSLIAFFADVQERGAYRGPDASPTRRPPELAVLSPLDRIEARRLDERIAALKKDKAGPASAKQLAALEAQRKQLDRRRRPTMITVVDKPRTIRILKRGDWMSTDGAEVQPAIPASLGRIDAAGCRPDRLDLARWLTSAEQPQTARVLVNRLWYLFFGAGLCRSLEDFGAQGEAASHPELLDWLAAELGESGWDVKHVVRLLVRSSGYRQSSLVSPDALRRDRDNRLFARQGRFRLPAELIRDGALAASGLLVRQVGGSSARPYQPEGYYVHLNFPRRTYKADSGPSQYRRGVYTHWQRQFLHPMLKAFDAPSREECTAQRPISNTPLQALTLLNDPSFVEAAHTLAARALHEGGPSDAQRIRWMWRTVLSRWPEEREVSVMSRVLQHSREEYAGEPGLAGKLLQVGQAPRPSGDAAELAAWTAVARVLLNLDETITRT
jgi:hypothetical protein